MSKRRSREDVKAEFRKIAKNDQNAADILLIDDQNFDAGRFLLASTLITALRGFQRFTELGVPFHEITPELIVEFAKHGETALKAHSTKRDIQLGIQRDIPASGRSAG